MNAAEIIHRSPYHSPAGAGTPVTPRGSTDTFAALMAKHHGGVTPTHPAGKGGANATTATQAPAAGTACGPGTYGKFIGRSTGSGQCVALVHATNPAIGTTGRWVRGAPVRGDASLQPGTVIATFSPSGHYANATDGSSHSAIYLGQTAHGVQVLDQWAGHPAQVRTIPWSNPGAVAANTGSAFHVVNEAKTATA
jgi:hypothetical protein